MGPPKEEDNHPGSMLLNRIERLINVKSTDPTEQRRGRLLALFILMLSIILIYTTIESAAYAILYQSMEYAFYFLEDIFASVVTYIFWRMNRSGKTQVTAYIFFAFLILFTSFFAGPKYFEYLMIFFALPVMISSFVIHPRSSFLFAFLTIGAYTIISFLDDYAWEYNLSATLSLFAVAVTSWIISSQLEATLHKNETLYTELQASSEKITAAYEATLEGWSRALELRDKETEGHTVRVTELTLRIAREMGFSEEELLHIRRGALLHDIGKLGVPDEILYKPNSLTEQEWVAMRKHPKFAYDLLSHIEYLHPALDIPYCHHEKWDGTGYPRGLKGEDIPLAARIFAIVDVYDALTSARPYREAWSKERTLDHIKREAGSHFDPRIVEFFIREVIRF